MMITGHHPENAAAVCSAKRQRRSMHGNESTDWEKV